MSGKKTPKTPIPFSFRQRVGKINWKLVTSLDVDDIIINTKIKELQHILDSVTFSECSSSDVRCNSIDTISRLIQIMQLIIEYLLHTQESQYQMINQQQNKIHKLKEQKDFVQKKNIRCEEDIKIYQRQIHLLRKTLENGYQFPTDVNSLLFLNANHPPRIVRPNQENLNEINPSQEIMKNLFDYEREMRQQFTSLLEEQKRTFSNELSLLADSVRKNQMVNTQTPLNPEIELSKYMMLIETMKSQVEVTVKKTLDSLNFNSPKPPEKNNVEEILRSAALETYEKELQDKAKELRRREEDMHERERMLLRQISELKEQNKQLQISSGARKANEMISTNDNQQRKQFMALQVIKMLLMQAKNRKLLKCFHHWAQISVTIRQEEFIEQQNKLILYSNSHKSKTEEQLEILLQQEKEKSFVLQSQLNHIQRELESIKEDYRLLESKSKGDASLSQQIKQEREKSVIATARYNSLMSKYEKEKMDLIEKLHTAESILAQQNPPKLSRSHNFRDTSIMTSIDFSTPKSTYGKDSAVGTSMSKFPTNFGEILSEEMMLKKAQERILSKGGKESVEQLAMASLAQEFMAKMNESFH